MDESWLDTEIAGYSLADASKGLSELADYKVLGYSLSDAERGIGEVSRGLRTEAEDMVRTSVAAADQYVPLTAVATPVLDPLARTAERGATLASKVVAPVPETATMVAEELADDPVQDAIAAVFGAMRAASEYWPEWDGYTLDDVLAAVYPDSPEPRHEMAVAIKTFCGFADAPSDDPAVPPPKLDATACLIAIEARYRRVDISEYSTASQLGLNFSVGLLLGIQEGIGQTLTPAEGKLIQAALADPVNTVELEAGLILGLVAGVIYGIVEDFVTTVLLIVGLGLAAVFILPAVVLFGILCVLSVTMAGLYVQYRLTGIMKGYRASPDKFLADMSLLQRGMESCFDTMCAGVETAAVANLVSAKLSLRRGYSLLLYFYYAPNTLLAEGKALGVEIGKAVAVRSKGMLERNAFFNAGISWGYNTGYIIYVIISLFLAFGDVLKGVKGAWMFVKGLLSKGSDLLAPALMAIARAMRRDPVARKFEGIVDQPIRKGTRIMMDVVQDGTHGFWIQPTDAVAVVSRAGAASPPKKQVVATLVENASGEFAQLAPPPRMITDPRSIADAEQSVVARGVDALASGTASPRASASPATRTASILSEVERLEGRVAKTVRDVDMQVEEVLRGRVYDQVVPFGYDFSPVPAPSPRMIAEAEQSVVARAVDTLASVATSTRTPSSPATKTASILEEVERLGERLVKTVGDADMQVEEMLEAKIRYEIVPFGYAFPPTPPPASPLWPGIVRTNVAEWPVPTPLSPATAPVQEATLVQSAAQTAEELTDFVTQGMGEVGYRFYGTALRPLGVEATITYSMLRTGQRLTGLPGGWTLFAKPNRGHLLAKVLGGPNLGLNNVALERAANSPVMSQFEQAIKNAVERTGRHVNLVVRPVYGSGPAPTHVIVSARQWPGWEMAVQIENSAAATVTWLIGEFN